MYQREYGLDWLRVIAFAILIGYHACMFFVPWEWHVKNPERSESLTWVMLFFNRWRLPLLFFISGAGVFFSLRRRSLGEFAVDRVSRLLLPLAFGIFVVVPPQIYCERLWRGQFTGSYLDFWKTVFDFVSYPQGNTSWHHLWFVAYILVYALLCIPLFALLKSAPGRRFVEALARAAERPGLIYLVGIPNIAAALWLAPHWPTTHNLYADWANFTGSLLTFLWGFIICGSGRFLGLVERKRRELLTVAVLMTAVFYAARVAGWGHPVGTVLIESYMGMGWILGLVGLARARLNRESPALRYATKAVYPFYVAHQTITVTLGFYMIGWDASIGVKLPLLMAGTFLGSWAIYEVVRRIPVLRIFMGITVSASPGSRVMSASRATGDAA